MKHATLLCESELRVKEKGVQVVWCAACKRAISWSLMTDSESPATLFELLYLFFSVKRRNIVYDNGCHFLDYALNRDPQWGEGNDVFVDELHYPNHTCCAGSFDTGVLKETTHLSSFTRSLCCLRIHNPMQVLQTIDSLSETGDEILGMFR
jgi:hypothetical protein